jgi:putative membrane protein
MMYWNAGVWVVMTLSMLAFWALVGTAIWLLVRQPTAHRGHDADTPEEVLRRRYAAGELDDSEFERRLQRLHDHSGV